MADTAAEPVWTIRALLDWTEKFLRTKGFDSPRLDAQILLAHTLGCPRIELYTRSEEVMAEEPRSAFRALIRRRVEGCPVAYLVGYREFYQSGFTVTPAVLIPRPETEFLVMEAVNLLKGKSGVRILDIGTGSGNIAISLAKQLPTASITAIDISPDALAVAEMNAKKLGVEARIRFLRGDLFAPLASGEQFEMIVSNPPYIDPREIAELAKEVRDYEPRIALDGGPEGLTIYRRLVAEALAYLVPGGFLLVEIGSTQAESVSTLMTQAGWLSPMIIRDLAKLPRVLVTRNPAPITV